MWREGRKDSQLAQIESVPQTKASLSKRNNDEIIIICESNTGHFSTEGKRWPLTLFKTPLWAIQSISGCSKRSVPGYWDWKEAFLEPSAPNMTLFPQQSKVWKPSKAMIKVTGLSSAWDTESLLHTALGPNRWTLHCVDLNQSPDHGVIKVQLGSLDSPTHKHENHGNTYNFMNKLPWSLESCI